MKLHKWIVPSLALLSVTVTQALAQVEKAAMRTTGISCGVCAAMSEFYLKRLPGIEKVSISLKNEAVMVSYKGGAAFQPKELRDALGKTDVGITQLQISARGIMREEGGKRFFIAGKDKFIVTSAPNSPPVPVNTSISVEAVVNDRAEPMEIRIMTFR